MAERTADTVERMVYVDVHDTIRETVHDTIRETVTVQLNAQGDTTRKDTEREHVSDRNCERVASVSSTSATQSSHFQETEVATHSTEVTTRSSKAADSRCPSIPKAFLLGFALGATLTGLSIMFARLRRRKT